MKTPMISDWQTAPAWQKFLLAGMTLFLLMLFFKDTLVLKPYRKVKQVKNEYQSLTQQIKTAHLLLADEKIVAENLGKAQKIFNDQIPDKKDIGPWLNQLSQGQIRLELLQPLTEAPSGAVFSQSVYHIELSGSLAGFKQFLAKMLSSHFHPEIKKIALRQMSANNYRYDLELGILTAVIPTQARLYPVQKNMALTPSAQQPILQGFWNGETPKALINGQLVGIGDYVGNHHVLQIKPNEKFVILEKDSKTLRLQL
jgi:hypothetical protein